ncbi:histidinol-phosphate transaminase [Brevibacillus nitrificans]|uniref:Histidinol-phosphate aminotransferase n=1 Tax=Brevibacillus nitrificans TaxID=651560 RepID=A0A3M8CXK7_9BACL|nr:histidinol-phosphate transaminase [Brevibacillus nitrificans]RNB80530.1 histidinol-phosphate transaminase [Brevibacillus nitrificans]
MSQELWRNSVAKLSPYVPGKPIEEVKEELGLPTIIRLASNENPFGTSPKAVQAMQKALVDSQLYPEGSCKELRVRLAQEYGIEADQIVVANGADHVIKLIGAAYINPGDEVIYCTPTFPTYRSTVLLHEGVPVEIPTHAHSYDLEAILAAITEQTKMIFVCNPNNPTGTILQERQLESFLARVPKHVIVVLDEAYIEFIQQPHYKNGIDYLKENISLITIRTFSKLYGLAGLRIGYAIGPKAFMQPLGAVREHFAVNRLAVAGALAALDDHEFVSQTLRENREQMTEMSYALQALGYEVTPSHANFLFIDMKQDTAPIYQALMKRGILIRPCGSWKLPTHARITIGTKQQNQALLSALADISLNLQES